VVPVGLAVVVAAAAMTNSSVLLGPLESHGDSARITVAAHGRVILRGLEKVDPGVAGWVH